MLLTFPQSNSEKLNTEKLLPTPHLSKIYKQYVFRFTRRLLDEIYTYFDTKKIVQSFHHVLKRNSFRDNSRRQIICIAEMLLAICI